MMTVTINTKCGKITGNEREGCYEFLGIRYATSKRFETAEEVTCWEGEYDATKFGPCCEQSRHFFQNLSIPQRRFYYKEFREGLDFEYSEDCLNLNIYMPKYMLLTADNPGFPVLVFIHGGGFNSMANCEGYLDGEGYAKRGIILVSINYRVGVLGYMAHEKMLELNGHDGNLGLSDQITALKWIKNNIASFNGNPEKITIMGQSAGAISVQDICLSDECVDIKGAIMMSGGGSWPSFSAPKRPEKCHDYWKQVIAYSGAKDFEEFKTMSIRDVLNGVELAKKAGKSGLLETMPVIDGYYLKDKVSKLINQPKPISYMIGVTNNDMFTAILAIIAKKYARRNKAYMYFFDVDAPGDDHNQAFHSSDLRYMFGTLNKSHRPYDDSDAAISEKMMDYVANFVINQDPNAVNLPKWEPKKAALHISKADISMRPLDYWKLFVNTFKGDPV